MVIILDLEGDSNDNYSDSSLSNGDSFLDSYLPKDHASGNAVSTCNISDDSSSIVHPSNGTSPQLIPLEESPRRSGRERTLSSKLRSLPTTPTKKRKKQRLKDSDYDSSPPSVSRTRGIPKRRVISSYSPVSARQSSNSAFGEQGVAEQPLRSSQRSTVDVPHQRKYRRLSITAYKETAGPPNDLLFSFQGGTFTAVSRNRRQETQDSGASPFAHGDYPLVGDRFTHRGTTTAKIDVDPYMPRTIRRLAPINLSTKIPANPETFSFKYLHEILKGNQERPCMYQSSNPTALCPVWCLLKSAGQPFLPRAPGHHGARISLVTVPPEKDLVYDSFPVFVQDPSGQYLYYGHYREPRAPDELSYDEMMEKLPPDLLQQIARETVVTSRYGGKLLPTWKQEALAAKLFGEREPDTESLVEAKRFRVISDYEERVIKLIEKLDVSDIMAAFQAPTGGNQPSLRLEWEFLQCTGYDMSFHDILVKRRGSVRGVDQLDKGDNGGWKTGHGPVIL